MTNPAIDILEKMQQEHRNIMKKYPTSNKLAILSEHTITMLYSAISRIEALGDGWIKCSERLPDNIKWKKILCAKWKRVFTAKYYDYMKCWIDLESTLEEIAEYDFWQPLPNPPKQ